MNASFWQHRKNAKIQKKKNPYEKDQWYRIFKICMSFSDRKMKNRINCTYFLIFSVLIWRNFDF